MKCKLLVWNCIKKKRSFPCKFSILYRRRRRREKNVLNFALLNNFYFTFNERRVTFRRFYLCYFQKVQYQCFHNINVKHLKNGPICRGCIVLVISSNPSILSLEIWTIIKRHIHISTHKRKKQIRKRKNDKF